MNRALLTIFFLTTAPTWAAISNRVVLVRDPATRVPAMVATGIQALTGRTNEAAAWQELFSSSDVVGIKISTVAAPALVTHQPVLEAIVAGLQLAGVTTNNIVIFDRDPKKIADAAYTGLPVTAIIGETGWDPGAFIESKLVGKLIWGDLEFGKEEPLSTRSHLPKLLTQKITKLINVPVLMNHDAAGIAGCRYNVTLGMADNVRRFEQFGQRPDAAIAELFARPEIRGKLVLNLTDALVAGYAGGPAFKPQYSWPHAGLYFSRDAAALDAVCLELLDRKRGENNLPRSGNATIDRSKIEFQEINRAP